MEISYALAWTEADDAVSVALLLPTAAADGLSPMYRSRRR